MSINLVLPLSNEEAEAFKQLQAYMDKVESDPLFKQVTAGNHRFKSDLVEVLTNRFYDIFRGELGLSSGRGVVQLYATEGEEALVVGHFEEVDDAK